MDSKFSLGLFIGGILTGCSIMIGAVQWVGVAILIATAIWGFLFVNPKSPARKSWWSTSGKLAVQVIRNEAINIKVGEDGFVVYVGFVAMPSIKIDRISLTIGRRRLWASNWEAREIAATEAWYVSFPNPSQLSDGHYSGSVYAHTHDGVAKSKAVSIIVSN